MVRTRTEKKSGVKPPHSKVPPLRRDEKHSCRFDGISGRNPTATLAALPSVSLVPSRSAVCIRLPRHSPATAETKAGGYTEPNLRTAPSVASPPRSKLSTCQLIVVFGIRLSSHCGCDIISLVTASSLIASDPEILGGTPVFKGTRVPVRTLFEYLADGLSLEYFLESFPSVTREQAADVLRLGRQRVEQEVAA
jgi:uncharacterized protein (DUF433 family)